jgi:Ser/Thr protein kinase RdoA (MazF antagonist)
VAEDESQVWTEVVALLGERPVGLERLKTGLRASVFRCQLERGTAIAKWSATATPEARRECDALGFLTEQPHALAPRSLAYSDDARLLIMEELAGEPLSASLERETVEPMRGPLSRIARELGHFHGSAAAHLTRAPASLSDTYKRDAQRCASVGRKLEGLLLRAAVDPASGFAVAWSCMTELLAAPEPYLTLTHGDLAPSNVLLTSTGPRFLDFEYAGVRSGLYDVLFWEANVPFPRVLAEPMTDSYRAALGAHIPEALDDALFLRQLTALKTHQLLWWLTFRLDSALDDSAGEWVPDWPLRPAYLFYLHNYLTTVTPGDELRPLYATAEALYARLTAAWIERPHYPVHFLAGSAGSLEA